MGIDQLLERQAVRELQAVRESDRPLKNGPWTMFTWRPRPYGRWALTALIYAFAWGIPALALTGTARTVTLIVVSGIAALHLFFVVFERLLDSIWMIGLWLRTLGIGKRVGGPEGREGTHPETEST